MRINQVFILSDATSKDFKNRTYLNIDEKSVLNECIAEIAECLDDYGVKYYVAKETDTIYPNSIIVNIGVSWEQNKNAKKNYTKICWSDQKSKMFAGLMIESMTDWARCCVDVSHRFREDGKYDLSKFNIDDKTFAIRIELFCLNGPMVSDYAGTLRQCSQSIAHCINEYTQFKNQSGHVVSFGGLR